MAHGQVKRLKVLVARWHDSREHLGLEEGHSRNRRSVRSTSEGGQLAEDPLLYWTVHTLYVLQLERELHAPCGGGRGWTYVG